MALKLEQILKEASFARPVEPQIRWEDAARRVAQLECHSSALAELCGLLFSHCHLSFGGLIVEERAGFELRYVFYGDNDTPWIYVLARVGSAEQRVPSVSRFVHGADWHEREAEDLFGLIFEGHPRLGNFVLHDDVWPEGVAPMRKSFPACALDTHREKSRGWKPRRIVEADGAFVMPVGPFFSVATEPVHFVLETVGEDVIRAQPRLFYTYRGLEKIAEGRRAQDVVLLAERISATSAFAHSLAFCQAVEQIWKVEVPPRARALRVFFAELERLRHHVAAIEGICESTSFAVAAAQAAILQEDLLRICGSLSGHRYLFGLNAIGGLTLNPDDRMLRRAAAQVRQVAERLALLERMLNTSSSFLDRLEEVGVVRTQDAIDFGMVGPVGRASAVSRDLRKVQPYCGYDELDFETPYEPEGDGYARLRVFFKESFQSAQLIGAVAETVPKGSSRTDQAVVSPGAALGWVEAPAGAALHWIRLSEGGTVERYRIITPSFANWHAFRLAAENFAFQDFPIILATFALSVHENDR